MTVSSSSQQLEIFEPATSMRLGVVPTATDAEIASKVRQARAAQRQWSELPGEIRASYLQEWRRLLIADGTALARELARENGKPYHEALLHEVVALAEALDFIASAAPAIQRPLSSTPRWFKHRSHDTRRRPRGLVAILSPFNFPLLIAGADSAAAIAMGCAAIVKPSPICPLIVERLVQLAHRAGIPEAILSVVHGGADVGHALMECSVDEVVFTGSVENGRVVAGRCGAALIPCTLELGGNCPLLVLEDADMDRTARAIALGAFTNSGQSCLAVGRVLVPRRLTAPLVERLSEIVRELRQGDPLARETDLGALSTRRQVERCRSQVEQAQALGAHAVQWTESVPRGGNFYPPTILADACTDSDAFRFETFGPVLPVVAYDDTSSVVELLNRDSAGLTAYVFGSDLERAERVARGLDYGQVVVDQVLLTYVCPEVPLAGRRGSGFGVTHGTEGLLAHTTPAVLGMPRMRLPTLIEFDWLNPKRTLAVAEGYLASNTTWTRLKDWMKR